MKKTDYKSVDIAFEEYGTVIVGAQTDEEASTYITETFTEVPSLRIVKIRETTDEEFEALPKDEPKRVLN